MVTVKKINEKVQDGSRLLFIRLFSIIGMAFTPLFRFAALAETGESTATTTGPVGTDFSAELESSGIVMALCGFVDFLRGPAAIIIGLIVIAGGGLLIAFGGKRAVSGVLVGIAGVLVALSAPQIIRLFIGGNTDLCGIA